MEEEIKKLRERLKNLEYGKRIADKEIQALNEEIEHLITILKGYGHGVIN